MEKINGTRPTNLDIKDELFGITQEQFDIITKVMGIDLNHPIRMERIPFNENIIYGTGDK
jgi:hypothetical protein